MTMRVGNDARGQKCRMLCIPTEDRGNEKIGDRIYRMNRIWAGRGLAPKVLSEFIVIHRWQFSSRPS